MKRNLYLSLLLCLFAIIICGNANAACAPEPTPQINKWVKKPSTKQKATTTQKAAKSSTKKSATKLKVNTAQTSDPDTTRAIGSTVVSEEEIFTEIKIVSDLQKEVISVSDQNESESSPNPTVEHEKIFTTVEQMPQFPGGEAALMKYLAEHLRYPEEAQQNNIQGRVIVQFVIEKTGNIGQVKVLRGKHPSLDKEAVRVIKSLPKFIPGKNNGQPVNCYYTLPINFKLQN